MSSLVIIPPVMTAEEKFARLMQQPAIRERARRDPLFAGRLIRGVRNGVSPQAAIHAGYDRAWATILDSNVTTLIAGLALLAFGSGPVRGFAVVHCLGILTSMFSAVFFSRGLVNLWYGRQKKLQTVSIGTVWRPDAGTAVSPRD